MPSSESQIKTAADSVLNRFGRDVITDRYDFRGDTTLTVARNSVAEVVRWLRDSAGFDMLVNLCSVDNMGESPRFEVIYTLTQAETGALNENGRQGVKIALIVVAVVLALALPQLVGNAVRQTLEGGALRFQFNWVNNSGGRGLKDGYFWFWVKNAGLPFILTVCACLCARKRGNLDIVLGMTAIYAVAETILFQPNEYDNNKLFYIWFMFAMILAADYGSMLMQRLAGLPGRALLCGLFLWASVFSGALSLGREAVSGYQLFSANAVAAGDWIRENTDRDDVFLTGQQHINPVCSLAGRQIICGSDLYVFFHGLDYSQQSADCRRFYEDPRENADVLETYNVHYIYVSDYERAEFDVDLYALDEAYELIYANDDVRIYDAGWRETP